jgi:hypothetical protein
MNINIYTIPMSKFEDNFSDDFKDFDMKISLASRQEINELMHEIYDDVEFLKESYAPPKLIRYYHELLSRLVKTYGH